MIDRPPAARNDERGVVLVVFALLLVGLFAFMALLIDLGLARLAQDQMQVAADGAALEGLRWRNEGTDALRRDAVRARIALQFDDDFDPTNGDRGAVGAGPMLRLENGLGETNASALLTLDDPPVYKPGLAANLGNAPYGDQVAGTYRAIPTDADGVPLAPKIAHREASDYARADFIPADGSDTAYLVRLRRTRDAFGLDRVPGASDGGPPIPFLFGLGGSIGAATAAYNPRRDGITVRATAIADARRALAVTDVPVTGPVLLRAAVPLARWLALPASAAAPYAIGADSLDVSGEPFAFSIAPTVDGSLQWVGRALTLGGTIVVSDGRTFVPITDAFDGIPHVIGFGQVVIDTTTLTLTKLPTGMSLHGASAGINRLTLRAIRALDPRSPVALPGLDAAHEAVDAPLLGAVIAR